MNKNKEKHCYITGAGEFYGFSGSPRENGLIIAADGGYRHLKKHNIKPDCLIGDFDSISTKLPTEEGIEIIALPKEKDDTDTFAAIRHGLKNGCCVFHIYGGTGGRSEHTYANIQCLSFLAENSARGFIYGKDYIITAVKNGGMDFSSSQKGYVSVFAFSEKAYGVSIKGLKYELDNVTLTSGFPLGVSNELIGRTGRVSVKEGMLIIFYPLSDC